MTHKNYEPITASTFPEGKAPFPSPYPFIQRPVPKSIDTKKDLYELYHKLESDHTKYRKKKDEIMKDAQEKAYQDQQKRAEENFEFERNLTNPEFRKELVDKTLDRLSKMPECVIDYDTLIALELDKHPKIKVLGKCSETYVHYITLAT